MRAKPFESLIVLVTLLLAVHAAGEGPTTGVALHNGLPTFTVDGQLPPHARLRDLRAAGQVFRGLWEGRTRVFMFNANAGACDYGHSKPLRPTPDTWDFTQFDERVAMVLSACPDGLLPTPIYLGTPAWWLEAHPEALEVLDDGATTYREPNRNPTQPKGRAFQVSRAMPGANSFSRACARAADAYPGRALRQPHLWVRAHGTRYGGVVPLERGFRPTRGYSQPTVTAFRAWLRARYHTEAALRALRGASRRSRSKRRRFPRAKRS